MLQRLASGQDPRNYHTRPYGPSACGFLFACFFVQAQLKIRSIPGYITYGVLYFKSEHLTGSLSDSSQLEIRPSSDEGYPHAWCRWAKVLRAGLISTLIGAGDRTYGHFTLRKARWNTGRRKLEDQASQVGIFRSQVAMRPFFPYRLQDGTPYRWWT